MSQKKPYFPNNWKQWKEVPDEFFYSPTYEEFFEAKVGLWELHSSVCCIIRETTAKGKVKEYAYQRKHAAETKIRRLMKNGATFTVCTNTEIQHIRPANDFDFD